MGINGQGASFWQLGGLSPSDPSDEVLLRAALVQCCWAPGLPGDQPGTGVAAEMKSVGRLEAVGWGWALGISLSGL